MRTSAALIIGLILAACSQDTANYKKYLAQDTTIRDRAGVLITALGQPEKHEFTFFNSYLQQISMPRFRGT